MVASCAIRKIMNAEKEWVPYICVVGEREIANGTVVYHSGSYIILKKRFYQLAIRVVPEVTRVRIQAAVQVLC